MNSEGMCMKRGLLLVGLMLMTFGGFSQKLRNVSGDYEIRVERNQTVEQAYSYVLEQAKIKALSDEFGTSITSSNLTSISSETTGDVASTKVNFNSITDSFVNGEWVETVSAPEYTESFKDGELWIRCVVKGRAREISKAMPEFIAETLSCESDRCKTTAFKNHDKIYLHFKSPVKGYLSVYMDDEANCQMLLPYGGMSTSYVEILPDKDYIFFSEAHAEPEAKRYVVEYNLGTSKSMEYDRLYLIFSTEEYAKGIVRNDSEALQDLYNLNKKDISFPGYMASKDFQVWLAKNRGANENFYVKFIDISIKQ